MAMFIGEGGRVLTWRCLAICRDSAGVDRRILSLIQCLQGLRTHSLILQHFVHPAFNIPTGRHTDVFIQIDNCALTLPNNDRR